AERSLRLERAKMKDRENALRDLLSTHVLAEWRPSPTGAPNRYVITFSHHVLFDYAVSRLFFRGNPSALSDRLSSDRELAIAIRPSLVFHLQYLWISTVDRR